MRPQKITFDMREMGVRGVLVYCAGLSLQPQRGDECGPLVDDLRLSDIEPRFVCTACGRRGAEVRPDFN